MEPVNSQNSPSLSYPYLSNRGGNGPELELSPPASQKNLVSGGSTTGKNKEQKVRLKSKTRVIMVGLILTISAIVFGLGLKEITSVKKEILVQKYSTSLDPFVAQSILIGILPIGSVFGALFAVKIMKKFQRLFGMYIFTVVICLGVGLVNINLFPAVTAGRFIEGISIGFFSAVAPIYMREIAPKQLRKTLGLFFSLGKVVGVLISIFVELILSPLDLSYSYRIILSLTAPFSILQAVLIFFFTTATPTELVEKGQRQQALEVIRQLYKQEFVEEVLKEYVEEHEADLKKGQQQAIEEQKREGNLEGNRQEEKLRKVSKITFQIQGQSQDIPSNNKDRAAQEGADQKESQDSSTTIISDQNPPLTFHDKKKIAHCLGVNICILRHFTGGNTVVTQGGIFIGNFNSSLGHYSPLIINGIQLIAVLFGLVVIPGIMGKKPLFILTLALLTVLNLGFTVSMIYQNVLAMIILMSVHTTIYGIFINATWGYPSEVIPANEALPSNFVHWIALSLATLVPPVVSLYMPDFNPYPVFIFFAVYTFLGFLHVRFYLRETDGLTYKQIIDSLR